MTTPAGSVNAGVHLGHVHNLPTPREELMLLEAWARKNAYHAQVLFQYGAFRESNRVREQVQACRKAIVQLRVALNKAKCE